MATEDGRQPIPPAKRRRLQQCFEHANKSASQGNFDYATDMFMQCVVGDPANHMYVQHFLRNLQQKYNNNKKGAPLSSIKGAGAKGSMKKASMQKDWTGVITAGLDMLKLNPWDVPTLTTMATASDELHYAEAQLAYLKSALEVNQKDVDVNRHCGRALARVGQFDAAIACWHRVVQGKPGDEEAQRAIGDLAIEKTIHHGGYDSAESSNEVRDKKLGAGADDDGPKLTPEQLLEKAISKNPTEVNNYVELADLHTRNERFKEAETVLAKALEVSGGDVAVRERLEDAQMRRSRQQLVIAEARAQSEKTPEAVELAKKMKAELNRVEIDVYRSRSDRYPSNIGLKYELGIRLKRAQKFSEAIQCFQAARGDAKRKGLVHMELGECFQYIKQYKLAMTNYESALEATPEREVDQRKLALYRAGKLAMALCAQDKDPRELEKAEKYLTDLASLEFSYKDVPDLLDKINRFRDKS